MKELILAIVTAVFPIQLRADRPGYCAHEFKECLKEAKGFTVLHRSQGLWHCSEGVYNHFSRSSFQTVEGGNPDNRLHHVAGVSLVQYSWLKDPFATLRDYEDVKISACWHN